MDIAIASLMLFAIMPIYGVGFHASLIMLIPLVGADCLDRGGTRDLDISAERKVPRHPICPAICDTDIDVSHAGHLSSQLSSCALAMGAQAQPSERHH